MAYMNEVILADLEKQVKRRRLEQTVKLIALRKQNEKENASQPCFNINPSSRNRCNVPFLRKNFRNSFWREKMIYDNLNTKDTSSIKNFSDESNYCKDIPQVMPCNIDIPYKSMKSNNKIACEFKKLSLQIDRSSFYPKKKVAEEEDLAVPSCSGIYANNFMSSQSSSNNSIQSRSIKIFIKWRVMLNAQVQLIIKGTLECGSVAQSKPIERRLTSTSVESVSKHLYRLQGNIVDDKHELPDYVRAKFYNGFPDDWKYVYQIWKTYVRQECNIMFRWPTPIADRDELMDVTFMRSKKPKNNTSNLMLPDSDYTGDILQPRDKRNIRLDSYGTGDWFRHTYTPSIFETWAAQASTSRCDYDKKSYKQRRNVNANCSRDKSNMDRLLKDKLNVIGNNLTYKHCSSVSITKNKSKKRNIDKGLELDLAKRNQWDKSSRLVRDKNAREMQEHFVETQENSAAAQKSARRMVRDSCNGSQNNERKTKRVKNKISEENRCVDANFANGESANDHFENRLPRQPFEQLSPRPKHIPSKTLKTAVILLVPVDLEDRKVSAIKDKIKTGQFNETVGNRNLTKKQSPVKSSATKETNSSLSLDSPQYSEKRVQVQASSAKVAKKSSRANLKLSKDKTADDRKPKLLSAWTPRVLNQSGLHLIFKGNLVNDAGHVVRRNFQTDAVVRRVSPKLIETVHRDRYQLLGELTDSKHDIPRQLLKQCRYGCPVKIKQFCRTWHSLKIENDPSMGGPVISVSAKGRKRMPPLNYWNAARSPEKLGRSDVKKSEQNKKKSWRGKGTRDMVHYRPRDEKMARLIEGLGTLGMGFIRIRMLQEIPKLS